MTDATQITQQMTELWVEVFGDESIEPTTDFYDLGGSSLQAVTLVSRIDEEFSVKVPAASVFEEGTPEGLASMVEKYS